MKMKHSANTPQGYRGGVRRLASCFWRNSNFRASVIVFAILFPLLLADRLSCLWIGDGLDSMHWNVLASVTLVTLTLALLGLFPLWVFGRYSWLFYAVVVPVEIVLISIEWFVCANFQMTLMGSWIGVFLVSSPEEIKWFLGKYLTVSSWLCIVLILAFAVLIERPLRCVRKAVVTSWAVLPILCVCLIAMWVDHRLGVSEIKLAHLLPAVNLAVDSVVCCQQQRSLVNMLKSPQIPEALHTSQNKGDPTTGVFVLGESATRNHWSLYGYGRKTTPCLDSVRDELTVFGDLVTMAVHTSEAMRGIFSTYTLENRHDFRYSMSQALAKCGFDVALYSNHRRWDQWYSDESFSFAACEPFVCMSEHGETNAYDNVFLKYLDGWMLTATSHCNRVMFLHFMGSHTEWHERYPPSDAPFGTQSFIDHYDNSIYFTDKILGEVVRKLRALHKPAWMIYLSDHGETPSAKNWRTATDRDCWEVPFVVWTSSEFNAAYPERVADLRRAKDKPLQSDQLLYGLLRFMGVEGLGNAPEDDFLSDAFRPRSPRLILSGSAAYEKKAR